MSAAGAAIQICCAPAQSQQARPRAAREAAAPAGEQ